MFSNFWHSQDKIDVVQFDPFCSPKVGLFIKKYEMKCGVGLEWTKTEKHGNCENNRGNIWQTINLMNLGIRGKTLGTYGGDKIPKDQVPLQYYPLYPNVKMTNWIYIVCKWHIYKEIIVTMTRTHVFKGCMHRPFFYWTNFAKRWNNFFE
jgi:hypothetical protein